ncbi:MAG: tRNA (adenosine(37)-N6)-dimethylallyltransferase MiaA [FCB group bacterium]|nr:tRNA (adenosine(37)-N6)-dimethylallyltransferase MiaA [FCB group bacterium]
MISVLAVVGPTASGKTALAIELAQRLETEIISADSMQVYHGMEIGTAAPTPEERAQAPHHLVSFLDPREHFSAGEFERQAREIVARLNAAGKPAIVVGGSGLYLRALIDGLFEGPARDPEVRDRLEREAGEVGVETLYRRLEAVDPRYASTVLPGDLRRIVRGLEVHEIAGEPLSVLHRRHREATESLPAVQVILDWPRHELYARIDARVDRMLTAGFLDEVRTLLDRGYEDRLTSLRSLGYREMAAHLKGAMTLDRATELMKRDTRRFAKRQLIWFRADPRVYWLPAGSRQLPGNPADRILTLLTKPQGDARQE